jgi:hypothetical protein
MSEVQRDDGSRVYSGRGEGRYVDVWVEGAPMPSFWTGLKTSNRRKLEVTTYRCASCGYLESYALFAQE